MYTEFFDEVRAIQGEVASSGVKPRPDLLIGRFAKRGLHISPESLDGLAPIFESVRGTYALSYRVPQIVLHAVSVLLKDWKVTTVCDPWAGYGELLNVVTKATGARRSLAFTRNNLEFEVGKALLADAHWQSGSPLELMESLCEELDVVAGIPPFNVRDDRSIFLPTPDGVQIELRASMGNLIIAASLSRLKPNGIGLFVVPPSFFLPYDSIVKWFSTLGFGLEAALALPAGAFTPYTYIHTYLIAVRKRPISKAFVGQLSFDENTNLQVLSNFRQGNESSTLELGRLVDPMAFSGLEVIRREDKMRAFERSCGIPATRLGELATSVNLGRFGQDFQFPQEENCIYIPLLGRTDVVQSIDDLKIKAQNYAQVGVNPKLSKAQFVAHFLNSELGREIREENKSGSVIRKLNKRKLKDLYVFVPDLQQQETILATEARIVEERNTLLALQNELSDLHRELWKQPRIAPQVDERLRSLSRRFSTTSRHYTVERLEQWFESQPFPLASILRAWLTAPSHDFKSKYEHLLHFFEAVAALTAVVFLSAFSSNEAVFAPHRPKIIEALKKQNLALHRATFGSWKVIIEYLGKQTRELLSAGQETRSLCAQIFSDPSLVLPTALSNKELVSLISDANKMRNDWTGHGGIVSPKEAKIRNEQLLSEVQRFREIIAETWTDIQLIRALHCLPRQGVFENEISLMMGTNREFVKELRAMPLWLDVDSLYLCNVGSGQALKLLPLIQIGPSSQSESNACYFFSRVEGKDTSRFVSYHFSDVPELAGSFPEAAAAIRMLALA